MIELIANIVILVSSAFLFSYWLRCAWLLIWNQTAPHAGASVANEDQELTAPNLK
jgi:hypothetical protein